MAELSYPQLQFTLAAVTTALWMAIEVVPERWWSRGRGTVTLGARYIGGTVLATSAMIYLRRHITSAPKPEMWGVFAAVMLASALLLTRREFLRRFVPRAGPDELGVVRFAIGLTLGFLVARDSLMSTLLIPENMIRRNGMVWWLHAQIGEKFGDANWLLDIRNPTWLRVVYWSALISGFTTMIGLASRFSAVILAVSFTLFYHTLCSYSHFFHVGLIPLFILYVLLFFPTGAGFSVDAMIRRRRKLAPIEAPPEVWSRGVYVAWIMYGLAYWAAGGSKLAQPRLWNMETLRMFAVRDSDILLEFDFDLAQRLVAWNLDEWVFGPAAAAVLVVEVCTIWVLFSDRARTWFPPILVSFHVGVIYLQGIAFFDLILIPLAFVPPRIYRRIGTKLGLAKLGLIATEDQPKPEIEAVIERREHNFARLILVAVIPGLVVTGWMFKRERFPLMTRWGMFESPVRGQVMQSNRIYAVYADGHRERTDLTKQIRALNNTRFRDTVGFPAPVSKPKHRKLGIQRIQALMNSVAAVHNEGLPESEWIVRFEIEGIRWDMEKDRDNPNWGKRFRKMTYVVGDAEHPEIASLNRRIKRARAQKKAKAKAKAKAQPKPRPTAVKPVRARTEPVQPTQ